MIQSSILAIVKRRTIYNLTRQNPFRPNLYNHELLWTKWDSKCCPPKIDIEGLEIIILRIPN
jgi:hypothetical protein